MTHHMPGHGTLPGAVAAMSCPVPVLHSPAVTLPARPDRAVLRFGIALRRECLANLETEMVSACEAPAHRGDPRTSAPDDRGHWDRTTWSRYLATATRLEGCYGPRMRRLRDGIARLERLLDLPVTA
jgi:hypothetical protein